MTYGDHYHPPLCLPGGLYDTLTPLAAWIRGKLGAAYDDGYLAGWLDANRERVDEQDRRPPTAGAVVTM
jgi:hypothetical protein